ncbi:MAG: protease pro-enzyme activation domain-containing protein [Candidatus Binatia bacterium]
MLCLTFGVRASHAAERYELRNSVSPRATAARWLRLARPDETLDMSLTLRLQHADELTALIAAQQAPNSSGFHRWLTPQEFTARFAPAPDEYDAAAEWLRQAGFLVRPRVSGLRIDFSGTVADVERTFGVRMSHYSHRGREPLANENPPLLPAELIDRVELVRLNTFPLAEPLVRVLLPGVGLVTAMAPPDMYVAYDVQKLLDAGVNGTGQTIAVVARSDFNLSDVASFKQQFKVPIHHTPAKVFPTTNPGVGAPNGACSGIRNQRQREACIQGEEGEVLLDTEWASAMAPGATVLVDVSGADVDVSMMDIVTNHAEAKIITMSFGMCERLDTTDLTLFGPMYSQAAAQGQTVLVATGDDGADDCADGRGRSVNVLSSDANVTAVGGTSLDPGFDANGNATGYVNEFVWNDVDGAGGGGVSTLVTKPGYQSVPGVPADGFRDQPDVSLLASPSTPGFVMVVEGGVTVAGGTSGSAPSWAGIVALLNQGRHMDGSGPLNATLYTLGRNQYASNGPAVFHDITHGNNSFDGVLGYGAGPGYDLASGLGTPDVTVLAKTLGVVTCAGDCNGDGQVTVNEILTGVNIALGTAPLSVCMPLDTNGDGVVTVDEILTAIAHALSGC